ncbi:MAG: DUF393 domain-containing protein [Nitrososphaerota archaeon]|nr:DUF393 domain-containing protein [Nitrososphaerota archaeon]
MRWTLVYDSDCGPCTRFRNAVGALDARKEISYVGLDGADRSGILDGISPSRRHRSFHLVAPDGTVWSGAEALAPLSGLLPGGIPLSVMIARSPLVSRCAAFVYGVFSRLHDTGACSYGRDQAARSAIDVDINLDGAKLPL